MNSTYLNFFKMHILDDNQIDVFSERWIARMINNPNFSLDCIPEEEKTYENCLYAVKHCCDQNIIFVPERFKTESLCWEAIRRCGQNLGDVPQEIWTYGMFLESAKTQGVVLALAPPEFLTYELCQIAVRENGTCLEFVPEDFLDIGLYRLAVESRKTEVIDYIPQGQILDQLREEYPNVFDP